MNVPKKKAIGILRDNENTNNNSIDLLHSKRRMDWTREWLLKRGQFELMEQGSSSSNSNSSSLLPEIKIDEVYYFNNFFKMTEKQFRYLVNILGPLITQQEPQRKRKFFSAEERLAITLKYLATGEIHTCRHYCFKASQAVILSMVTDISMKIYENLKDDFIKTPSTVDDWREVSKGFLKECQLPNCVGAVEGRHIAFRPPRKPNVRNYRFYDDNTIVLMAVIDAYSNFLFVDLGIESNLEDKTIFNRSLLKESLENQILKLPKNDKLPNLDSSIPSFLVGSYSFPLKSYLMKPFYVSHLTSDQLYFDFKMWDVSQKAENCIEMLTNIFPVLLEPFKLSAENAKKVILGCIALYNFLRKSQDFKVDEDENFLKTGCLLKICKQDGDDESVYSQRAFLTDYVNKNRSRE